MNLEKKYSQYIYTCILLMEYLYEFENGIDNTYMYTTFGIFL